jgi:hypothetical protein
MKDHRVALTFAAVVAGVGLSTTTAEADSEDRIAQKPYTVDTWAFCGVNPSDPAAQQQAYVLANIAGIDATMGPCLPPTPGAYTAAYPGARYADRQTYAKLVKINANVGMKTVVYDAAVWSDNADVRKSAIKFWTPMMKNIKAWDMGDEFDPDGTEWPILVHRCEVIDKYVTPLTGVRGFTNHLPWAIDAALRDMPTMTVSFDQYDEGKPGLMLESNTTLTKYHPLAPEMIVAINTLKHGPYDPTYRNVIQQMRKSVQLGADKILVFGGAPVIGCEAFQYPSLVTSDGTATILAHAVKMGSFAKN